MGTPLALTFSTSPRLWPTATADVSSAADRHREPRLFVLFENCSAFSEIAASCVRAFSSSRRSKKFQGHTVEVWVAHERTEARASRKVEPDDFVLRNAKQIAVRTEPQTPRTVELHAVIWSKDANEPSHRGVVLADCGNCLSGSEGMLARDDGVAARCEQQIERTKIRVIDQSWCQGSMLGGKRCDRSCSFTGRSDTG